jgi:hypothetical protein
MPLSSAQKGAIGQFAFLATALATGKGQVEVYSPAADNEGRDAEVRRHLKPTPAISVQVKVTFSTASEGGRTRYLAARFDIAENRVQHDPRLWYFFAYFDVSQLRFHDPAFLVPSHVFHRVGRSAKWKGKIVFQMWASLSPKSRDRWSPYRIAPIDLGKRLLEIIDEAPLTTPNRSRKLPPGSIWLGRAKRRSVRTVRGRAA